MIASIFPQTSDTISWIAWTLLFIATGCLHLAWMGICNKGTNKTWYGVVTYAFASGVGTWVIVEVTYFLRGYVLKELEKYANT